MTVETEFSSLKASATTATAMAGFKLYYFNFWGRGEICRLLLAASCRDWEDIRFTKEEWHNTDKYKQRRYME